MGSGEDRGHSRPPKLEDLLLLCQALNEERARYMIIGGFAMILHGYTRGTMDIDLLVDPSIENIRRVKAAMAKLPDNAAENLDDADIEKYQVVRVADEFVVDLMGRACGLGFEDLEDSVIFRTVDGVIIPYADVESLIRTKDTVRPKDKQDVLFLRMKEKDSNP